MFNAVSKVEDIKMVESFIGDDAYHCPYFYANLKKYGNMEDRAQVFVCMRENAVQAAALLYFDCLHVYFKNGTSITEELIELVNRLHPRTIFSPSYPDQAVQALDGYTGKEVLIMAPQHFIDIDTSMVKKARLEDIPRIAEFMYTHWSDVYDSAESIRDQMEERIKDNYGRTEYVESEGEIVACVSSFAELDDFAICGGLLVSTTQRGKKLGSVMLRSIYEQMVKEGKRPCGIIVEDYSRIFHEKNGFSIVGTVIKYNQII